MVSASASDTPSTALRSLRFARATALADPKCASNARLRAAPTPGTSSSGVAPTALARLAGERAFGFARAIEFRRVEPLQADAAGALAGLATAGVGGYHVGVEQGWWEGPASCSAQGVGGVNPDALFEQIMAAPIVRCDEIAWQMAGLSMAGWNMVISLGLAALWIAALRVRPTA